jgi:hypothetical protein
MFSPATFRLVCLAAALAVASPALAQVRTVSPNHKFCWAENTGFMDWRDANNGAAGVRLSPTFLSGFTWGENIGWVNFGNGSPANGNTYTNTTGADFGVNRDLGTGNLSGLAWGENVGWINFAGGSIAGGAATAARYDAATGRLRGYAWGENIGWINLDDASTYVAFKCPADFNGNGTLEVQDIFDYLSAWFVSDPNTDFDFSGSIQVQDIFDFLSEWFAGC